MSVKMKDFQNLAREAYYNRSLQYNNVSGDDAIRNAINEVLKGDTSYQNVMRCKYDIYQVLGVALDAIVPQLLQDQFSALADIRQVAIGQKPVFKVTDPRTVRIGLVGAGSQSMRRQTIVDKNFTIETDWYGASLYAEWERFQAGEINWTQFVDRVAESFSAFIQERILNALTESYTTLGASDKVQRATLDSVLKLAERISVKSRKPVAIYGSKTALGKLSKMANLSGNMKDELNKFGYIGVISGVKLMEIPQAFKMGTEEFALDDDTLLVVPDSEQLIGVVLEGDAQVIEPEREERNDLQLGFRTIQKIGVGVLAMRVYGMAKFAA